MHLKSMLIATVALSLSFTACAVAPKGHGTTETSHLKIEINAVVQSHMSDIKSCYKTVHAADPNIEGAIDFKWTFDRNGKVIHVAVRSNEIKNKLGSVLASCIEGRIASWSFPATGEEIEVERFPFYFRK